MTWLSDPDAWSALAALLALEIVLGVDNVIFILILASKLPADQQQGEAEVRAEVNLPSDFAVSTGYKDGWRAGCPSNRAG